MKITTSQHQGILLFDMSISVSTNDNLMESSESFISQARNLLETKKTFHKQIERIWFSEWEVKAPGGTHILRQTGMCNGSLFYKKS